MHLIQTAVHRASNVKMHLVTRCCPCRVNIMKAVCILALRVGNRVLSVQKVIFLECLYPLTLASLFQLRKIFLGSLALGESVVLSTMELWPQQALLGTTRIVLLLMRIFILKRWF